MNDLRFALRLLRKSPGFTLVAVLTLALGIGANTAIFTVFDALLLKPLPFAKPEQLVRIYNTGPQLDKAPISPANFLDWQQQNRVFQEIAAYTGNDFTMLGGDVPEHLLGARVSAGFFNLLGVQPSLGRPFRGEEDAYGRNQLVILSHQLWQKRFGGRTDIIGQSLTLNDKSLTIVGVMPADFTYPGPEIQLWTPMAFSPAERVVRDTNYLSVIGRLKVGVDLEQARAQMNLLARQIAQQHPELNAGDALKLVSLTEATVGEIRPILYVLLGAVGLVLLICCANVANLLLARAAQRQKEIAIRTAIGANQIQLVRLLLVESLLLAVIGGSLGFLLAFWGIDLIVALKPENLPPLDQVRIDWSVLLFTGGISLTTGLLFGLAPLQTTRPQLSEMLKEGDRTGTSGPARHRVRDLLVVSGLRSPRAPGRGRFVIRSFVKLLEWTRVFDRSCPHRFHSAARFALPQAAQEARFQRLLERVRDCRAFAQPAR
jgi:putative ABC transport system permease protein